MIAGRRATGFTLIELLMLVSILAILAVMALPAFLGYARSPTPTPPVSSAAKQ